MMTTAGAVAIEWVSVEDRMPPDFEEVLVTVREGSLTPFVTALKHVDCEGWTTYWDDTPQSYSSSITHWAELPNAFNAALVPTEAQQ